MHGGDGGNAGSGQDTDRAGAHRHGRTAGQRALVTSLPAALAAHGVAPPAVRIRDVTTIPRTALGKAPFITTADTERS